MHQVIFAENLQLIRNSLTLLNIDKFKVNSGEHWIILGPNGSGKTSFIKCITLYEWPTRGELHLFGIRAGSIAASDLRKNIGIFEPYLQQEVAMIPEYMTALDIVCTGYDGSLRPYNEYAAGQLHYAADRLRKHFGHDAFPEKKWNHLSSGEKRRVLLLRTILNHPELVIFDEPFEFLDLKAKVQTEIFFSKYFKENPQTSSLTVLHRPEEIPAYANKAALMKDGEIIYQGEIQETVTTEKLSEVFEISLKIIRQEERYTCVPVISEND